MGGEGGNRINDILNRRTGSEAGVNDGRTPADSSAPRSQGASIRPTPPESPFGGIIAGAVGGSGVKFTPSSIEALGKKLISEVGAELTAARRHLNDKPRNVEAGSFTTFGAHLAHAYIQATEYADTDLITKARHLVEIDDGLRKTAQILRQVEEANTLKPG